MVMFADYRVAITDTLIHNIIEIKVKIKQHQKWQNTVSMHPRQ